jgi:hypothetical protein
MIDFSQTNERTPKVWKEVYGILSKGQNSKLAADSDKANNHSIDELTQVQQLMWDSIASQHTDCLGLDDVRTLTIDKTIKNLQNFKKNPTMDSIQNPVNGIGTLSDPSQFTYAYTPVSLSPFEATGIYSSGGIPKIIIDKKSKGILQNGIGFKTEDDTFWTNERMDKLVASAYKTGFEKICSDAIRDSTIYGGALLYPCFKTDSVLSFGMNQEQLLAGGLLSKNCISHWAYADRWNTVFVPDWNISAKDYLYPSELYVPISGISINTERAALIRSNQLPYWAAITNMGWGQAEAQQWITSVYAYYIVNMSIPIMAQQMSLLLYQLPFDALEAQIGVDTVREIMKINEDKIREWSILNPKAVNMVGEVITINRTFSGFEHFMDAIITDLMARSGLARPLIFHTPSKGFADNTTESLLKQSETIKSLQKEYEPTITKCTDALIAHTFGTDSEEWKRKEDIYMSFDRPVVATDKDRAEIGARFAATENSLVQGGVPPQDALEIALQFFPSAKISEETMKNVEKSFEEQKKLEKEQAKQKNAAQAATGTGNGPRTGKPAKQHGASNTAAKDSIFQRVRQFFNRELTDKQIKAIIEEDNDEEPDKTND